MKKLTFFNKIVFFINSGFAFLLLLSYLTPYIDPELIWVVAFFGLGYPILLFINFLFLIYWLVKLKIHVVLPIIAIGVGWSHLENTIQLGSKKQESPSNNFKLMSFNVRLFDLYNWTNNVKTRDGIFNLITREDADILCFQEFYNTTNTSYFNTLDTLMEFQKAKNIHVNYTKVLKYPKKDPENIHSFGIVTMSKFPIINKGFVELKDTNNNVCIYSDLLIENDTVRVYNMHLASIRFKNSDYEFIENIRSRKTQEQISGSKLILKRLKSAFIRRSYQANAIAKHISESPFPVVVAGDFNDTPTSFAYKTIGCGLIDGFKESGMGFGITYNGKFPAYRIDYILHSKDIVSNNFSTLSDNLSDHFPITCNLSVSH